MGEGAFAPSSNDVRGVLDNVSITKLYVYHNTLFDFDSKNITRPGNAPAAQYLLETLRSFGYDAELQWFEARSQGNTIRTANVLATLRGTENPELVYILSSHFDSHASGPGARPGKSRAVCVGEAGGGAARGARSASPAGRACGRSACRSPCW